MNVKQLIKVAQKPKLFEKSTSKFWDDEHISKKMLEAHLNPDWDAASRKHTTIDKSVEWLSKDVLSNKQSRILDLGCGPGLYSSRLARRGHTVTGIDFSKRSIEYAKKIAKENKLDIDYIYKNYLDMDYEEAFDLIILIYGDFGVLSDEERDLLLSKIHRALKPGGKFVVDVFTDKQRDINNLEKSWYVNESGFWSDGPHLSLSQTFYYPENSTFVDQVIVIDEKNEMNIYRIWEHIYSKSTLIPLLDTFKFKEHEVYSDVTGKKYDELSKVITVVTKK